jgi:hypothetical protein
MHNEIARRVLCARFDILIAVTMKGKDLTDVPLCNLVNCMTITPSNVIIFTSIYIPYWEPFLQQVRE